MCSAHFFVHCNIIMFAIWWNLFVPHGANAPNGGHRVHVCASVHSVRTVLTMLALAIPCLPWYTQNLTHAVCVNWVTPPGGHYWQLWTQVSHCPCLKDFLVWHACAMAPSYDNHSKVLGGETMAAIVILLAKINQNTFVKPQKITLIIGIGKNTDYYSVVADS